MAPIGNLCVDLVFWPLRGTLQCLISHGGGETSVPMGSYLPACQADGGLTKDANAQASRTDFAHQSDLSLSQDVRKFVFATFPYIS